MLTQKEVKERLEYQDGKLIWKKWRKGKEAGTPHPNGYKGFKFKGKYVRTHRIIFLFHHGYLPKQIDHINRLKSDNRIENLRAATQSLNQRNKSLAKKSKSGKTGVCYIENRKAWMVTISINGRPTSDGRFKNLEDAIAHRKHLEVKHYGELCPS